MTSETSETSQTTESAEALHHYFEVGNDLLAKPDTLCQVLLMRNMPRTVVFCNSPSEADMVEVMLKKKSITCAKLIGNVPHQKVIEEVSKVQNGETTALVITDVAAHDLEIDDFELVVNYGIHEDPEIYLHRITGYETSNTLKEVVSLVSPLDFGNFHYLRKVVTFDFEKAELPSQAELAKAQSEMLFASALDGEHLEDQATQELMSSLLEHESRDQIIAMLLFNTLKTIPSLQEELAAAREKGGNRRGRGEKRNSRDSRRRDDDSQDDRGNRRSNNRNERRERRERDTTPPKRDSRMYIGHGSESGFSEEAFKGAVSAAGLDADSVIKRLSIRPQYSFLDVPEEVCEEFLSKIEGSSVVDGEELFIRKATLINVPREESENKDAAASDSNDEVTTGESDNTDDCSQVGAESCETNSTAV